MAHPKLTKLELQVLEPFWQKGACSVREIQETFPESARPAYTTVQTTVYRLERKKALRCVKRISNANIFEAVISRKDAQRRLIDELLLLLGGRGKLVMAHLVDMREITLDDVKEAEKALRKSSRSDKPQRTLLDASSNRSDPGTRDVPCVQSTI
jgi:BlaI family penicillinase repressor